jgi:hypothetical protein
MSRSFSKLNTVELLYSIVLSPHVCGLKRAQEGRVTFIKGDVQYLKFTVHIKHYVQYTSLKSNTSLWLARVVVRARVILLFCLKKIQNINSKLKNLQNNNPHTVPIQYCTVSTSQYNTL